jgi:hypothetical protein
MKDEKKTREQLMVEMAEMQQRIVELEKLDSEWEQRRLFSVLDGLPGWIHISGLRLSFR